MKTKKASSWCEKLLRGILSASMVLAYTPMVASASENETSEDQVLTSNAVEESVPDYESMTLEQRAAYDLAVEESVDAADESAGSFSLMSTATTGVVACGDWQINYSYTEGAGATITGVSLVGTGELVIPSSIESEPVTTIGNAAFKACTGLTSVSIPSTVTKIGDEAFRNTGLTSIDIPSSVTYLGKSSLRENAYLTNCVIPEGVTFMGSYTFKSCTALESVVIPASMDRVPYECFRLCSSLKNVTFSGSTMRYIHRGAFEECTSLESIHLPLLTAYPDVNEEQAEGLRAYTDFGYCIGNYIFYNCTNLKLIECGGPIMQSDKALNYFAGSSCVTNCSSDLTLVYEGASSSIGYGTTGRTFSLDEYDSLDFYDTAENAANYENKKATVSYRQSTDENRILTVDIVSGTDYSAFKYEGCTESVPAAPEGKVWGIESYRLSGEEIYWPGCEFDGSVQVVAVDPDDLRYGWVDNAEIRNYYDQSSSGYPSLYLNAQGEVEGLSDLQARGAGDDVIDSSLYTLSFDKASYTYSSNPMGGTNISISSWDEIGQSAIVDTGLYRVKAEGVGENSEAASSYTYFYVKAPEPDYTAYYDEDNIAEYLGSLADDAGRSIKAAKLTSSYDVLVPSSDWRAQLLGAGFAGASLTKDADGNTTKSAGLLLFDCGDYYSSEMTSAHIEAGSLTHLILGSTYDVPESSDGTQRYLADYVESIDSAEGARGGARYGENATDAQQLSYAAITSFSPSVWQATWGNTALICSDSAELTTIAATQYAYHKAAKVFFLQSDGTLASDDLALLKDSSIENIVLVGDEYCVSDSVAQSVSAATGLTPSRILTDATTTEGSIDLAQSIVDEKISEDSNCMIPVVIADASDPVNVSAAAMLAEVEGGIMLTCRTSADARLIQEFLQGLTDAASAGLRFVSDLDTVGEFEYLGSASDVKTAFLSTWSNEYVANYDLNEGDTFESNGLIYQLLNGKVVFVERTDGATEAIPESVTYEGVTYAVTTDQVLGITSQPQSVYANVDAEIAFSISTNDDSAQYSWHYSVNGGETWRSLTGDSTLEVNVTDDNIDYLYQCTVTFSDGTTQDSNIVRAYKKNEIYQQPENIDGQYYAFGDLIDFTTCAMNAKEYQWQYSSDSGSTWHDVYTTGADTMSTYETYVTEQNYNYWYRCNVQYENGASRTSSVVYVSWPNEILFQPKSVENVSLGDEVAFSIGVPWTAYCQWQKSLDGGENWTNISGANSSAYSAKADEEMAKAQYRCRVTYNDSSIAYSDVCTAQVNVPAGNQITAQPENVYARVGDTVNLSLAASDVVSYQWQYSSNGTTWKNKGTKDGKTSSIAVAVTSSNIALKYRCVVNFQDGTQDISDECGVLQYSEIVQQPEDIHSTVGNTIYFRFTATNVASYQWQYSKNNGETWKTSCNAGCRTSTLKVKLTADNIERVYRCAVTYADGTMEYTDTVKVIQPSELTSYPQDAVGAAGSTVYFGFTATNVATYQWQYSTNSGSTWKNSSSAGCNTNTLKITLTAANIARWYHCVVTFNDGTQQTTDPVKAVTGEIVKQPTSVVGSIGNASYFEVTTNDANATYQWQYSNDEVTWKNSNSAGNAGPKLKITPTSSTINRKYRCVIQFNDGQQLVTDTVRITTA